MNLQVQYQDQHTPKAQGPPNNLQRALNRLPTSGFRRQRLNLLGGSWVVKNGLKVR